MFQGCSILDPRSAKVGQRLLQVHFYQHLGFFLHLNFQSGIYMDVFLLDGKAKVGTQTFEKVVGVGSGQLFAEKVLNVMLDVQGVDFLDFCNAMVLLCVDQKIQGVIVITLDGSVSQSPKLTVQFEFFQTVFC